ncbi:tRNA (adenine(22)-N(1))-methyltransferase TrmK [Alginatibacterium sediminis]|uniref:tRNA (adenine(22)-N(1))-methyltransferase TrmK n=1 Tax=Alginatibacterium sediminis TaxID=2164068 RepID=UPI001314CDEE|nr:tRNA (adenine(22)-N(1))-methyltransferase TrmK [Alginatibacterium sediminis]
MKLNKRLSAIRDLVTDDYAHIWDCCCDHGHLGASLLDSRPKAQVHFVDLVDELILNLGEKLAQYYPLTDYNWLTHCLDLCDLNLSPYPGKHLLVIAGVGGELCAKFVSAIVKSNPNADIEFLLCPVHHQFELRSQLIELKLGLLHEALILENNRFYEILWVNKLEHSSQVSCTITDVGVDIWQENASISATQINRYMDKTLQHYQRKQLENKAKISPIIAAYQSIRLKD